ncbi:MAG TPA: 2-phosphosulfolactate phosphatase, partial [Ktedonobacteraceae bacterium]|nr:2-phosphosulfolactate phosphatase [Ktedonobacteraceae bacterium]
MEILRVSHSHAAEARGVVVVIDVIRAFSVAAYAFAGGARSLWLVRTVEEARALREREPDALLVGEVGGRLIEGFDFNNSPSQMAAANVRGRLLIQRTGAGTRGAVAVGNATLILLCSLTNAQATASYARKLADAAEGIVSLFPTAHLDEIGAPNEDTICADYLEALLFGRNDAPTVLANGIAYLHSIKRFAGFAPGSGDFPAEDVPAVLATNHFNFAMVGERKQWREITYVDVH